MAKTIQITLSDGSIHVLPDTSLDFTPFKYKIGDSVEFIKKTDARDALLVEWSTQTMPQWGAFLVDLLSQSKAWNNNVKRGLEKILDDARAAEQDMRANLSAANLPPLTTATANMLIVGNADGTSWRHVSPSEYMHGFMGSLRVCMDDAAPMTLENYLAGESKECIPVTGLDDFDMPTLSSSQERLFSALTNVQLLTDLKDEAKQSANDAGNSQWGAGQSALASNNNKLAAKGSAEQAKESSQRALQNAGQSAISAQNAGQSAISAQAQAELAQALANQAKRAEQSTQTLTEQADSHRANAERSAEQAETSAIQTQTLTEQVRIHLGSAYVYAETSGQHATTSGYFANQSEYYADSVKQQSQQAAATANLASQVKSQVDDAVISTKGYSDQAQASAEQSAASAQQASNFKAHAEQSANQSKQSASTSKQLIDVAQVTNTETRTLLHDATLLGGEVKALHDAVEHRQALTLQSSDDAYLYALTAGQHAIAANYSQQAVTAGIQTVNSVAGDVRALSLSVSTQHAEVERLTEATLQANNSAQAATEQAQAAQSATKQSLQLSLIYEQSAHLYAETSGQHATTSGYFANQSEYYARQAQLASNASVTAQQAIEPLHEQTKFLQIDSTVMAQTSGQYADYAQYFADKSLQSANEAGVQRQAVDNAVGDLLVAQARIEQAMTALEGEIQTANQALDNARQIVGGQFSVESIAGGIPVAQDNGQIHSSYMLYMISYMTMLHQCIADIELRLLKSGVKL